MVRPIQWALLASLLFVGVVVIRARAQTPDSPKSAKLEIPTEWNGRWILAEIIQDGTPMNEIPCNVKIGLWWEISRGSFEACAGVPFGFCNTETGTVTVVSRDDRVYRI